MFYWSALEKLVNEEMKPKFIKNILKETQIEKERIRILTNNEVTSSSAYLMQGAADEEIEHREEKKEIRNNILKKEVLKKLELRYENKRGKTIYRK